MKKFMKFMLMAVLATVFTSCSSDDEPEVSSAEVKAQYENVVSMLYDADSKQPAFTPTQSEGVYIALTASSDSAHSYMEKVLGKSWDGKTTVMDLGEYGKVQLIGGSDEMKAEGIYNEIVVNVKDYTPFTLRIIDMERAKEDNEAGYTETAVVI